MTVRLKESGSYYAMKIIPKARLLRSDDEDTLDSLLRERNASAALNHPFINRLQYSLQTDDHAILVLDIVDGAKLTDVFEHYGGLSEEIVRFYVAEIALALNYMHSHFVLYRDLKVANVLVQSDGHICLVDLGLVRQFEPGDGADALTKDVVDEIQRIPSSVKTRYRRLQFQKIQGETLAGQTAMAPVKETSKLRRRMSVVGTPGYMA